MKMRLVNIFLILIVAWSVFGCSEYINQNAEMEETGTTSGEYGANMENGEASEEEKMIQTLG